jgi:glycosyltransferase involved in cell wall biosynthesis
VTIGRPLRVCHVITRLIVGGAQEAAIYACAYVDQGSFSSVLVAGPQTGAEGDLRDLAGGLGVPIVQAPSLVREIAPGRDVRALRQLRRVFRELRPDVVHTHSSKAGLLGRLAARRERVPTIVHTVHGWSFHDQMAPLTRAAYVRLERRAARWTDRIVTVSTLDREKGLAARVGVSSQYRTIHELNDLRRYSAGDHTRSAARASLGLPLDSFVVGAVGRLSEQKDPQTWVRAASLVAAQAPDARFVMIGDGDLRAVTERAAAELGVADRLLLTGLRDDVPAILPAMDVLLLTSRWEGLPLVIPQAMAAGVPVVATAVDGNREIVHDGENGLLAPPGDPELLAGAVLRLRDHDLACRLVDGGSETARDFSLERTIPQLEQLYLDCARAKVAASPAANPPSMDGV